jgi:hypothetical protein
MSSLMARYGTQLAMAGNGAGGASNSTGGILSGTFGKAA